MKMPVCLLLCAMFLSTATSVWSIPAGFNVQGRLTDTNGINKPDTDYQVKFSIYTSQDPLNPPSQTPVWEKTETIHLKNGNFQKILNGNGNGGVYDNILLETAVQTLDSAYLEITVINEPPLIPRQPLLRSPFSSPAVVTGKPDVLIQSDSQSAISVIAMRTGGTDRLTIQNNGNVGVGTVNPSEKLSVGGTIEAKIGGFKFPDGTIQATALSNCVFKLKPVAAFGQPWNGESGNCSFSPAGVDCSNSRGFSWYMEFSVCYTCGGATEVCGPATSLALREFD